MMARGRHADCLKIVAPLPGFKRRRYNTSIMSHSGPDLAPAQAPPAPAPVRPFLTLPIPTLAQPSVIALRPLRVRTLFLVCRVRR